MVAAPAASSLTDPDRRAETPLNMARNWRLLHGGYERAPAGEDCCLDAGSLGYISYYLL
jgi:hypothetical protein